MKIRSITISLFLLHLFLAPLSNAEDKITYTKDIAPIFQEHCLECHRPGQMGPFFMLDYKSVRPWAKSIRKEVYERRMPPWHADPSTKTKFANDRSMTQEEIDTIVKWVDQGAPKGNSADLAPPVEWTDGWNIGEPDVVLKMPVVANIPAEGEGINANYRS